MPFEVVGGTVSELSNRYSGQGYTSIFDTPEFRESGLPRTIFEGCEILFHSSFDLENGAGRLIAMCPSAETPAETPAIVVSPTVLRFDEGDGRPYSVVLVTNPDPFQDGLSVTVTPDASGDPDITVPPPRV